MNTLVAGGVVWALLMLLGLVLMVVWIIVPFVIFGINGKLGRLTAAVNQTNVMLGRVMQSMGQQITATGKELDPPAVAAMRSDVQAVVASVDKTNRILMAVHNVVDGDAETG